MTPGYSEDIIKAVEEGFGPKVLAAATCSPALAGLIARLEAAAKKASDDADATIYDNLEAELRVRAAAFEDAVFMARQCQEAIPPHYHLKTHATNPREQINLAAAPKRSHFTEPQ